jgi:hypothetical protein
LLRSPLLLTALVTLANAVKPVAVDDTAYLLYARHIANNPTNPYGFTHFWWSKPEPAMGVLAPPVVPYWLATGIRLVGESPPLLKLWMFPFVLVLAWALRAFLVRFARGAEDFALPLLMLSPAILPTVNLMLDVPAVALALASVEVFIRSVERRSWRLALSAGIVAGLAMQTKYTAFVAPAVIAWYGLTHRRFWFATVAAGSAIAVFTGWELWLVEKYGQSHFWFHATASAGSRMGDNRLLSFANEKFNLIPGLVGQFGGLAVGVGLLAGWMWRFPRRYLICATVAWSLGFGLIVFLPHRWLTPERGVGFTRMFWLVSGWTAIGAVLGCASMLLFRVKKGLGFRLNAESFFLVGWLLLEIGAALALTPFPAARRVIGITLVGGLLAARAASRIAHARPERLPPWWALAFGIAIGIAVAAIDVWDAFPEKVCAERAAEVVRERPDGSTVWFVGHWGFQYYCDRAGMQPLVAGETHVRAGDFVVVPIYPTEGFFRPDAGFEVREPLGVGDEVAEIVWNDWLSAQTVPNFYGGIDPVTGRDYPRLRVRIYRLRADWTMR